METDLPPVLLIDEAPEMKPTVLNELWLPSAAELDARALLIVVPAAASPRFSGQRGKKVLAPGSMVGDTPCRWSGADRLGIRLYLGGATEQEPVGGQSGMGLEEDHGKTNYADGRVAERSARDAEIALRAAQGYFCPPQTGGEIVKLQ